MSEFIQYEQYEAFLLKAATADNLNVIIGGFCPKDKKQETINTYLKLSNYEFGQSKDIYIVDYLLAEVIKNVSPSWVIVTGASISIDGVNASTGGIIGNPFEQVESADEELEEIYKDIYLISFPGGPGVAFEGKYSDGTILKNKIIDYKSGNCRKEDLISHLDKISTLYILVEDGCGFMNPGGIYVKDFQGKRCETF